VENACGCRPKLTFRVTCELAGMPETRTVDQAALTKYGFLLAVAMFATGVLGEALLPLVVGQLPGWEHALFTDLEALGILLALVSVFGFGIAWPLLE
jgi:hydrogenase/urease accessory protein HupE